MSVPPRLEVVVNALRAGRLDAYRANVLELADRIDVQAAPHLRGLLIEQEARLRDAGPTVRDYELGRAVLEALDEHDRELEVNLPPATITEQLTREARLREELDDLYRLLGILIGHAGGEVKLTEEELANAPRRPSLEVIEWPDGLGRAIRLVP